MHANEIAVEVNGGFRGGGPVVLLVISDAITGEGLWSGTASEQQRSPDLSFSTDPVNAGSSIQLPTDRLLLLRFTPQPCNGRPNCTPLSAEISYVWAGRTPDLPVGSFYRPINSLSTPDTVFDLLNGHIRVNLVDSGYNGYVTDYLGEQGWTLPYDRTALCAQVSCSGSGPTPGPTQFFSAGVQTRLAPDPARAGGSGSVNASGPRVIPTFPFKGTVNLPAAWGAQTWDVPELTLRFAQGASLNVTTNLGASGTTFTSANPAMGWGGIRVYDYVSASFNNVTVEHVNAGASIAYLDAEPNVRNSFIQNSVRSGVDGIYASGFQLGTIDNVFIQGLSGNGVTFGTNVEQPVLKYSTLTGNSGNGVFLNAGASGFLGFNSVQGNGGHGLYAYGASPYLAETHYGSVGKNVLSGNGTGGVFAEAGSTVMGGTSSTLRQNSFVENGQPGGQWFDPPGDVREGPDAWVVDEGTVAYLRNGWWGRPANPDTTTCASVPCGGSYTGMLFVDPMLASDPGGGAFGRAALGSSALAPPSDALTGARARLLDAVDASVVGRRAEAFALLQATADGARGATVGAVAVSETGRLVVESKRGYRSGDDVTVGALVSLNAWAAKGSPYRARALATLVQVRHATGDPAGALEAAAELAAEADPAAALEGHYARFHLLLGSARRDRAGFRQAAAALAVLERVAPESAQVGWARHALAVEGGVRAMREAANAGSLPSARATATAEAATGDVDLSVWPNPSVGRSTVGLTLAEASDVSVVLYDVLGREAAVVHRGRLDAGAHRLSVDGAALPAGTYVVRAQVGTREALVRTLTVTR